MSDELPEQHRDICTEVRETLLKFRSKAYSTVNFAMLQAYWQIGCVFVENEQKG